MCSAALDFKSDNQAVSLKVTNSACNDAAFASTDATTGFIHQTASGAYAFKPLEVYTCGALYDPSSPLQLLPPASFATGFCESYTPSFRMKARGMRVTLHNKLPGGALSDGITSSCLPASVSTPHGMATSMLLPSKIPFTISLFDDAACSTEAHLVKYHFDRGLENSLTRTERTFDYLLRPLSSSTMVGLIADLSRRGTTPFLTEVPGFFCNSTTPANCLKLPSNTHSFVVSNTGANNPNTLRLQVPESCASIQAGFNTANNGLLLKGCEEDGQYRFLQVEAGVRADGTTDSFGIDGISTNTYSVYWRNNYLNALKELIWTIGYQDDPSTAVNSVQEPNSGYYGVDDQSEGDFADVKGMLAPSTLGGLFWDQTCSATALPAAVKRTVSFVEDGVERTYLVILTNPGTILPAPSFFYNHDPRTNLTGHPYHRRFIIREFMGAYYRTQMVIDIACDSDSLVNFSTNVRNGRMEEIYEEVMGTESNLERKIMFWNTSSLHNSRFEVYRYSKEEDTSANTLQVRTSFVRGEKFPNPGNQESDLRLTRLYYDYYTNKHISDPSLNTFGERLVHKEIDKSSNIVYNKYFGEINLTKPSGALDVGKIFATSLYLNRIDQTPYGSFLPNDFDNSIKVLADGQFVAAYVKGAHINIDHFNGSNYTSFSTTLAPNIIATDINYSGSSSIVAAAVGNVIYLYRFYNGSWSAINSVTLLAAPTRVQAAILGNDYIIATLSGGDITYLKGSVTTNVAPAVVSPATHLIFNTAFDDITDFVLTKSSVTIFLAMIRAYGDSPNNDFKRSIALCPIDLNNDAACRSDVASSLQLRANYPGSTDPNVRFQDLSLYNWWDSGLNSNTLTLSYTETDATLNPTSYKTTTSSDGITWNPVVTISPSDYYIQSSMRSSTALDASTYVVGASVTGVPVQIPYVHPALSGFRMNFKSLNPNIMPLRFTNRTTFEAVGDGL